MSRLILTAILVSLLAFGTIARADAQMLSIQDLYYKCQTRGNLVEGYCIGVAHGVLTTMRGNAKIPGALRACTALSITNAQAIQIFKSWAEKNTERWQEPGVAGMVIAFREAYPCD